jgi:amidase
VGRRLTPVAREDPLAQLDATAQAALVASGELRARDLVEAACARIEALDPRLGAVPVRLFDEARAASESARAGPFAGVPFLMKDVGARQAGQPYYAGNRALRDADHRAAADTPLGARFREVGLVTVGNSNTPEFGLQSNTWPLAYGPTRNPWNLERSPGGSSGGACVAVAAGLVPIAHASDGAGSIRIPASWCGLVGLKPSRDRIVWRHAGLERPDVEFVVARSLRDTALALDALRALPGRGPMSFLRALREPAAPLRIGLCWRAPDGSPVDIEVVARVEETGRRLEAEGHAVAEAAPEALFEWEERALHGAALGLLEYQACLVELAERLARPIGSDDVEPFLWQLATEGVSAHSEDAARSAAWSRRWVTRLLDWFARYDVLVTPTVNEPAPPLESLDPDRHTPMGLLGRMVPHMAFTEPWNATGQPALSLPLGLSKVGLPIGVQLVAAPGREDRLLALAVPLLERLDGLPARPAIHA